jgi:hypothetical protein
MVMENIGVKDAFNTFNTVQKFAPAASGINGNISTTFKFESLLGKDMMPVISAMSGQGTLKSDQLELVESKTFDKIRSFVKLSDKYTSTFKNINASFTLKDGRVYIKPFDTKLGNIKMNVGGDQGLDQTMSFLVKTEIPRSDLGESVNSLVNSLASQASALGLTYKPSDIVKINMQVSGTFSDPVIKPVFGDKGETGSPTSAVTSPIKEMATEKVSETAKEQSDKILKEAEIQAQKVRDEAASAAKTIREQADVQGAKLIKEAEAKGTIATIAAKKTAEKLKTEADKKAAALETKANAEADKLLSDAKAKSDALLK